MTIRQHHILSVASAIMFAITAAGCRYHWRWVETRWQIVAFVVAAGAVEGLRRLLGDRPSAWRWAAMSAAAAVAITTEKFVLEPFALRADAAVMGVTLPTTR